MTSSQNLIIFIPTAKSQQVKFPICVYERNNSSSPLTCLPAGRSVAKCFLWRVMPHFGLMDEYALGPVEGPLMRARLHIRGGKRRLRQGKISAGIVTLYDALCSAMDWYIAVPERRGKLQIKDSDDLNDDKTLFAILSNSGIIDNNFDYPAFNALVEKAAQEEMPDYDFRKLLEDIEAVMTRLGVMPFDEKALPPEDPATF